MKWGRIKKKRRLPELYHPKCASNMICLCRHFFKVFRALSSLFLANEVFLWSQKYFNLMYPFGGGKFRARLFSHATASHGLAVSLRNFMLIKKKKPWILILIQLNKGQPLFLAYDGHMEAFEKDKAILNELFF